MKRKVIISTLIMCSLIMNNIPVLYANNSDAKITQTSELLNQHITNINNIKKESYEEIKDNPVQNKGLMSYGPDWVSGGDSKSDGATDEKPDGSYPMYSSVREKPNETIPDAYFLDEYELNEKGIKTPVQDWVRRSYQSAGLGYGTLVFLNQRTINFSPKLSNVHGGMSEFGTVSGGEQSRFEQSYSFLTPRAVNSALDNLGNIDVTQEYVTSDGLKSINLSKVSKTLSGLDEGAIEQNSSVSSKPSHQGMFQLTRGDTNPTSQKCWTGGTNYCEFRTGALSARGQAVENQIFPIDSDIAQTLSYYVVQWEDPETTKGHLLRRVNIGDNNSTTGWETGYFDKNGNFIKELRKSVKQNEEWTFMQDSVYDKAYFTADFGAQPGFWDPSSSNYFMKNYNKTWIKDEGLIKKDTDPNDYFILPQRAGTKYDDYKAEDVKAHMITILEVNKMIEKQRVASIEGMRLSNSASDSAVWWNMSQVAFAENVIKQYEKITKTKLKRTTYNVSSVAEILEYAKGSTNGTATIAKLKANMPENSVLKKTLKDKGLNFDTVFKLGANGKSEYDESAKVLFDYWAPLLAVGSDARITSPQIALMRIVEGNHNPWDFEYGPTTQTWYSTFTGSSIQIDNDLYISEMYIESPEGDRIGYKITRALDKYGVNKVYLEANGSKIDITKEMGTSENPVSFINKIMTDTRYSKYFSFDIKPNTEYTVKGQVSFFSELENGETLLTDTCMEQGTCEGEDAYEKYKAGKKVVSIMTQIVKSSSSIPTDQGVIESGIYNDYVTPKPTMLPSRVNDTAENVQSLYTSLSNSNPNTTFSFPFSTPDQVKKGTNFRVAVYVNNKHSEVMDDRRKDDNWAHINLVASEDYKVNTCENTTFVSGIDILDKDGKVVNGVKNGSLYANILPGEEYRVRITAQYIGGVKADSLGFYCTHYYKDKKGRTKSKVVFHSTGSDYDDYKVKVTGNIITRVNNYTQSLPDEKTGKFPANKTAKPICYDGNGTDAVLFNCVPSRFEFEWNTGEFLDSRKDKKESIYDAKPAKSQRCQEGKKWNYGSHVLNETSKGVLNTYFGNQTEVFYSEPFIAETSVLSVVANIEMTSATCYDETDSPSHDHSISEFNFRGSDSYKTLDYNYYVNPEEAWDLGIEKFEVLPKIERPSEKKDIIVSAKYNINYKVPDWASKYETDVYALIQAVTPDGKTYKKNEKLHIKAGLNENIIQSIKIPISPDDAGKSVKVIITLNSPSTSSEVQTSDHVRANEFYCGDNAFSAILNGGGVGLTTLLSNTASGNVLIQKQPGVCNITQVTNGNNNEWTTPYLVGNYNGVVKQQTRVSGLGRFINTYNSQQMLLTESPYKAKESYTIKSILFKSKMTEDLGYGDNGWIELLEDRNNNDNSKKAVIKAGYGFELRITSEYATNAFDKEVSSSWGNTFKLNGNSITGQTLTPMTQFSNIWSDMYIRLPDNKIASVSGGSALSTLALLKQDSVSITKGTASAPSTIVWKHSVKPDSVIGVTSGDVLKEQPKIMVSASTKNGVYDLGVSLPVINGISTKQTAWGTSPSAKNLCDYQLVQFVVKGSHTDDLNSHTVQ